ncbi:MAG TPA: hypothetical protein VMU43_01965 [Candidatus Acidoferrum sp.]|nr:hypothetical protein [Candidatus Acidoferrum sp.]
MRNHFRSAVLPLNLLVLLLFLPSVCRAQASGGEDQGINEGNYNVQQTVEFGYRGNWINGNQDTYDTFINLGSGVRLFDYSLDMRSLNHDGLLFDNLSFSNFGYGGDPNDVSRLRIEKNKYYDFRMLFRRDKNFWDWNLFANPLNPISTNPAVSPTTPIANSPHSLDLVRRMQDYDLTLLPQSRIRFRLGYSRDRDEGPGFFTTDSGTIPQAPEFYGYTTNAYRAGIDFRVLPRTTLSYDQFLTYFKQDNSVNDTFAAAPGNFGFQLGGATGPGATPLGTPLDLGIIWANSGGEILPCAAPVTNANSAPLPTVTGNCNGFISYTQVGRPRNFMPTERFRFQSNYFRNFETSGSFSYTSADNSIPDFLESVNAWTARTSSRGETTGGPAKAKLVSVNADWSGVYAITDKFRVLDFFRYYNWRTPGIWDSAETTLFGAPAPAAGVVGLALPIGQFTSACNTGNGFNGSTCPQHSASSAADVSNGLSMQFLGQNLKSNTLQAQYDFKPRLTGRIGFRYTNRVIGSSSDDFNTGETYFPGGATATAANYYLAARGACALVAGALPAGCVLNADGSITIGSAANPIPDSGNSTDRDTIKINEYALLVGLTARPIDALRITSDFEFGYNDHSFTRTDPRQLQSYKVDASYKPRPWADIDGSVEIHENRDNVFTVDNLEHDRMYNFSTVLSPSSHLSVNFGYTYWDVLSQIDVCYSVGAPAPVGTTPCPTTTSPVPLGALSVYTSTDHFAYGGLIWKVNNRVSAQAGFDGSFVRGTSPYFNQPQFATTATTLQQVSLNTLQPSGTLNFNYLKPYAGITIDLYKGLSYKMNWNYYGFNVTGTQFPAGLALTPTYATYPSLQLQNFNGSTATFGVRYAF